MVIDGDQAAVEFDDGVAPGEVAVGAFFIGTLDAPGDDFPAVAVFQNFPFGAVGPVFLLVKDAHGDGDLVAVTALRVFRMSHAAGPAAASGEEGEEGKNEEALKAAITESL